MMCPAWTLKIVRKNKYQCKNKIVICNHKKQLSSLKRYNHKREQSIQSKYFGKQNVVSELNNFWDLRYFQIFSKKTPVMW